MRDLLTSKIGQFQEYWVGYCLDHKAVNEIHNQPKCWNSVQLAVNDIHTNNIRAPPA